MVKKDKTFCDMYEEWKMNQVQQQQKEYYDSLDKKAKQEKAWSDFLSSEADRVANEIISDIDREIEAWSERTIREAEEKMSKAQQRKRMPVYSGVMQYFPDALLAVSECSMAGNNQHHENKPLHWDRNKSNDHLDCLARHLIDADKIDDDGIAHLTKVAWRALAALQIYLEDNNK